MKNAEQKVTAGQLSEQLHKQFVEYGKNAREWMRKCELLLPEIERKKIWKRKNFLSIYEYAAKLAGMSKHKVDDSLRILRKIEDKPELMKVAKEKGLQRVRPVVTIATKETAKFWADKANNMSKNVLVSYLKGSRDEFRAGTKTQPEKLSTKLPNKSPNKTNKTNKTIAMELDPTILSQLEKLKGDGGWNDLMKEFLDQRKNQLEKEKPEPIKTKSRHIPKKIKQHVIRKTKGKCAFPGCNKKHKILHHTKRFALNRIHDPDTIVPLCCEHERLAHLGLIENEEQIPETWCLRKEPDRTKYKNYVDQYVALYRKT